MDNLTCRAAARRAAKIIADRGWTYFVESDTASLESRSVCEVVCYLEEHDIYWARIFVWDPTAKTVRGIMQFRRVAGPFGDTAAAQLEECLSELYDEPGFAD
jgi:hypothetical protein